MGRAFFFATGIYLTTCGVSLLPVERVHLNWKGNPGMSGGAADEQGTVVAPPRWLSFSLMTVGSVAALYAVALPSRRRFQDV